MIRGHAVDRVSGADLGNRALVAVYAAVMPDLQEQGAIAEPVAALDTFGAADAERLVDGVFVVRVFDVGAFDRRGRALAVFRRGV